MYDSFQDTPVALLALSRFGNLTFTKDAENTVEISAGGSFKKVFQVTSSNSVLLQQVELPNIPGNYSVEVKGSGCVYIQVNGIPSPQVPLLLSHRALVSNKVVAPCYMCYTLFSVSDTPAIQHHLPYTWLWICSHSADKKCFLRKQLSVQI